MKRIIKYLRTNAITTTIGAVTLLSVALEIKQNPGILQDQSKRNRIIGDILAGGALIAGRDPKLEDEKK
jgi:hypothetical protein